MRKAIQHPASAGQLGRCLPVVLLVQKKTGLLPLDVVHIIFYPVFGNGHMPAQVGFQPLHLVKALSLLQSFQRSYGHIISLVDRVNLLVVLPQQFHQRPVHPVFAALHAQGKHLRHQYVFKAIHRQPRELIRLAKNKAAAAVIHRAHHRFTVIQRIAHPPPEKRLIKGIIGIAADDPHPDFGVIIHPAGAQVPPFITHHIHHITILVSALHGGHFLPIHPGVAGPQAALRLRGNGKYRIFSCCHSISPTR